MMEIGKMKNFLVEKTSDAWQKLNGCNVILRYLLNIFYYYCILTLHSFFSADNRTNP